MSWLRSLIAIAEKNAHVYKMTRQNTFKRLLLFAVLSALCGFGGLVAEEKATTFKFGDLNARTWRDQKSARAIDAILKATDGEKIALQLRDGRVITLELSRFHEDDRSYVQECVKDKLEMTKWEAQRMEAKKVARRNGAKLVTKIPLKATASTEDMRTFKDVSGNSFKAEILGVKERMATLRLEDDRVIEIRQKRLSQEDRTFLLDWGKSNPSYFLNDLRLSIRKSTSPGSVEGESKSRPVQWKGFFHNRTWKEIKNITIKYVIYIRNSSREGGVEVNEILSREFVSPIGNLAVGENKAYASAVIQETHTAKSEDGMQKLSTSTSSQTIEGAVFDVFIGKKRVITYTEPRGFLKHLAAELERKEKDADKE